MQTSNLFSYSESLLNIINGILDLSKIEAGNIRLNPEQIDIHKLIKEKEKILSSVAENKGLSLKGNIEKDLPMVIVADEIRLKQVINNLVGNAIKFTDTRKS